MKNIENPELQERISKILDYKEKSGKYIWLIGKELKEIKEKNLWLPQFKDWGDFTNTVFNFHPQTAHSLIAIHENFEMKDAVLLSWHKLHLLKSLPASDQAKELIRKAPEMTEREIKAEVLNLKSPLKEPSKETEYFLAYLDLLKRLKDQAKEAKFISSAIKIGKTEAFHQFKYKKEIEGMIKEIKEIIGEL